MSSILEWLTGGDLRSDGPANEVVKAVLNDHQLVTELLHGLEDPRDVVRGRSADALEKIGRELPSLINPHLEKIVHILSADPVPMVRWHLAMLLGHLAATPDSQCVIYSALVDSLRDDSVFTVSWAVVSLCILARLSPDYAESVTREVQSLAGHPSKAIQTRVRYALPLLVNPERPFPSGWIKSKKLALISD
jgi:hypothetical protein